MFKVTSWKLTDDSDYTPEELKIIHKAEKEAERGYTRKQLKNAIRITPGRPLSVGSEPATEVVKVRLDPERNDRLNEFAHAHSMSRSGAVRLFIDQGLAGWAK
jgi:hypothetical protein